MEYHIARGGVRFGPYAAEQLAEHIRSGRLGAADMAWREGLRDWISVARMVQMDGIGVAGGGSPPPLGGSPQADEAPAALKPPSHMALAIITTLCCCLPFGVVSIVHAAQVDSRFAARDYCGAADASKKACLWGWIGFVAGLVANSVAAVLYACTRPADWLQG